MKVYVAGPLFNPKQVEILQGLEMILEDYGYRYYSPRADSGSHLMTSEDRKDFNKWTPVFDSNEQALYDCDIMVAVLEYALPEDTQLALLKDNPVGSSPGITPFRACPVDVTPIELPDSGTVWEMGYMRALGKPIVGYHSTATPKNMNLMLTHGVTGMCFGLEQWKNLVSNKFDFDTLKKEVSVEDEI